MLSQMEIARAVFYGAEAMAQRLDNGVWVPGGHGLRAFHLQIGKIYSRFVEIVQTLAAGGFFYAPSEADLANPEVRPMIDKFVRGRAGVSAEERIALFKMAWDVTGETFGQRMAQYVRFYSGDPIRLTAGFYMQYDKAPLLEIVERALGRREGERIPVSPDDPAERSPTSRTRVGWRERTRPGPCPRGKISGAEGRASSWARSYLGVRDLEAATRRMEAEGFAVQDGGVHPGLGTANRIIPLGGQYLELLGVVDESLASSNWYGRALLDRIADGDRLVRWSLRTDRIDEIAGPLRLIPERRSRLRPDGRPLQLARRWAPGRGRAWLAPVLHAVGQPGGLSRRPPRRHPNGAHGIAWLELSTPDPSASTAGCRAERRPCGSRKARPGLRRVGVATREGEARAGLV